MAFRYFVKLDSKNRIVSTLVSERVPGDSEEIPKDYIEVDQHPTVFAGGVYDHGTGGMTTLKQLADNTVDKGTL